MSLNGEFQHWSLLRKLFGISKVLRSTQNAPKVQRLSLNLGGTADLMTRPFWGEFFYLLGNCAFSQFSKLQKSYRCPQDWGCRGLKLYQSFFIRHILIQNQGLLQFLAADYTLQLCRFLTVLLSLSALNLRQRIKRR